MTTHTRTGALVAGLTLAALSGPLMAGPLGNQGYAPNNGYSYGPANGYSVQSAGPVGSISSVSSCYGCGTPAAVSHHPGPKEHCPPPYYHVFEGPPRLKFKKGCPRPVCDPCELPHFGYFQTCWSPWPYPPDWRHCPYPTASDLLPPPSVPPFTPKHNAERTPESQREPKKDTKKKMMEDDDEPELPPARPQKLEQLPFPEREKNQNKNGSRIGHSNNVRLLTQ